MDCGAFRATHVWTMANPLQEYWQEISARPEGPLAFRFYFQPLMAAALAVRDGIRDARRGRPAYLWAVFSDRPQRKELVRDGWRSIAKVFVLAVILDLIYQVVVLKGIRPVEGLLIAIVLAIIPYALLRGPVNRIARRIRNLRGHTPRPSAG
jgi:hypothetical protein